MSACYGVFPGRAEAAGQSGRGTVLGQAVAADPPADDPGRAPLRQALGHRQVTGAAGRID
jgi:hypothetical protein